jgi:hypothetical protein
MAMQDYLYAVVDRLPRTWNDHLSGLVGVPVQTTTLHDFVVLRSRLAVVPAASPKTLAAHHDVVASLMEADAIVPFPFGTALASGESDSWFASHASLLRGALAKVRGCVEMNVKLLRLNVPLLRRVGIEADERDPRRAAHLDALGERLVARAGVDDWRYRVQGNGSNMAASVAFLVPRLEVSDFLTRIAPIASRANGVAVVPTGPWPAYSFVPTLDDAPTADRLARAALPERAVHRRVS